MADSCGIQRAFYNIDDRSGDVLAINHGRQGNCVLPQPVHKVHGAIIGSITQETPDEEATLAPSSPMIPSSGRSRRILPTTNSSAAVSTSVTGSTAEVFVWL